MKKTVNIQSRDVLYVLTPPMAGIVNNVQMELADIRMCLVKGADVEEVLKDGTTIKLDLDNYRKDFYVAEEKKEIKIEEKIEVKESIEIKEVVEEAPVEEVKEEEPTEEIKEEVKEEVVEEVKEEKPPVQQQRSGRRNKK